MQMQDNNVSNASWLCYRFVFDGSSRNKIERKSQICTPLSVIALIIAATAQSYFVLEIASLLIELLL
jgi:hypothetical protein